MQSKIIYIFFFLGGGDKAMGGLETDQAISGPNRGLRQKMHGEGTTLNIDADGHRAI